MKTCLRIPALVFGAILLLQLLPQPTSAGRKLDVTFLFHANQNLVPYGKVADLASFRGLLQTLRRHPALKFQIHFSGTLLHDLLWFGDSTLTLIRQGAHDGQLEIFGSTYNQNVMYSTRLDTGDFEFNDHQIKIHKALIEKIFGVSPKAFWNPERVWTQNFVQLLADNGYEFVPVEDHILQASGATGPLEQARSTHYNGRQLIVFEDDKNFLSLVDQAINSGDPSPVVSFLHAKYAADTLDRCIIGYYQDAEATGLWDFESGINPQTNFNNLDILLRALETDTLVNVTTYEDFLKSGLPLAELTPIVDGAAAWMGGDAWFAENQDSRFQTMRTLYHGIRNYIDSVAQVMHGFPGDTSATGALLRHAWFTLCAHQFEFGCHGLESDATHAQLQLARTARVSARAALFALSPTSAAFAADVNDDSIAEQVLVTPLDMFVFSPMGGRLLYWFDLRHGEEMVGAEEFMADYIEPYTNDNTALPLIRGGIETYSWLAGNPVLPEVFGWTFRVRRRALDDFLTLSGGAQQSLENSTYTCSLHAGSIIFTNATNGITVRKEVEALADGLRVTYSLASSWGTPVSVDFDIQNSLSPSFLNIMDNGRGSLGYRTESGSFGQTVTSSTIGVANFVTGYTIVFAWITPPDRLSGNDDVFGLELDPGFSRTIAPGDSVQFSFSMRKTNWLDAVNPSADHLPEGFRLEQNFPNPFNPETQIRYSVPQQTGRDHVSTPARDGQAREFSTVKLAVYDLLGREIAVLVNEEKAPGTYEVSFKGTGLATGVYICRLKAGEHVEARRMLLLK